MHSTAHIRLVAFSAYIASAVANCCFLNMFGQQHLNMLWDDAIQGIRCGMDGALMEGTGCWVENSKDAEGDIQALVSVFFGTDRTPFKYRLGINPGDCSPLPADQVATGWEGWGAQLFKDNSLTVQDLAICDNLENQLTDDRVDLVKGVDEGSPGSIDSGSTCVSTTKKRQAKGGKYIGPPKGASGSRIGNGC